MSAGPVALGIDLGTSGVKAVAVDESGRTVAEADRDYPLLTPQPGWTEQRPEDWWEGARGALRELTGRVAEREIVALGLSGQMHGMVPLGGDGEPVRPAILWNDQRTAAGVAELERAVPRGDLVARGGNPAITGFQLPKLLWLRQEEPDAFRRTARVLFPKDWLGWRLTGEQWAEPCDASGSNAFHLAARDWDRDVLGALDLAPELFPGVIPSDATGGRVTAAAAAATGLPEGLPVVAGAGDNAAAATGLGLRGDRPAAGSLSLGTSGVVQAPLPDPEPAAEGRAHLFCHADGGYLMLGVTLSAAGSLRWLRDTLFPERSFDELLDLAGESAPGAGGVSFHPWLAGERTPYLDSELRASWQGLSLATGAGDLVRAVLEGVAFSLRAALDAMRPPARPERLLATGGGSRSALWLQLCADALELDLGHLEEAPGAAYGAALLAFRGAGRTVDPRLEVAEELRPEPDAALREALERYRERSPAL